MVVPVRPTISVSNVRQTLVDLASSAYDEPFDPSTVAGLQYDYRSDAGLYTTSAGSTEATADTDPVGRWEDQSGNGRHLLQASSTKRPILKTGVLASGKAVVRGDGVDDLLKAVSFTLAQPVHFFMVLRQHAWTDNDFIVDGNSVNGMAIYQNDPTPNIQLNAGTVGPAVSGATVGTPVVVTALFSGTSSSLRINGGTATVANAGTASPSGLTLFGPASDNTQWANVDIGRVIAFNAALSTSDREYIEAGLAEWAGIT